MRKQIPIKRGILRKQRLKVKRLDALITTQKTLDLETLLAEDSTFYGDLFPHVVKWRDDLYLEDGVHRALRNALYRRAVMYARVLDLDQVPGF